MWLKGLLLIFIFSLMGCDGIPKSIFGSNIDNIDVRNSDTKVFQTKKSDTTDSADQNTNSQSSSIPNSQTGDAGTTTETCTQDSDCVLVSKKCCSCSGGGLMIAIHKSQQQSYEQELDKQCGKFVNCPGWYRCGEQSAKCQNSRCVTIEN